MDTWKQEMLEKLFPEDNQHRDINTGLTIKYNHIPSRLYKYYSFVDYNKNNLTNNVIWLSFPENFNDPYDCVLTYSNYNLLTHFFPKNMDNIFKCVNIGDTELTELEKEKIMTSDDSINTFAEIMIKKEKTIGPENKDKILNAIIAAVRSVSESLEPSLKNVAKKTLVSCFSEINDSIVMWSHYADKHRGFCIEYDFKSLPLINKTSVLLYPVVYQSELFDITDYIKSEKNSLSILLGIRAAITKSKEWEYEREWRLIRPFEIFTQEMEQDVPLPTAIYAGVRISSENNDFLKQYCKRTKISLFQAEMDEHKFKINFRHE